MGIVDKIKLAASVDVVEKLLQEGSKFDMVSDKTKRRWRSTAQRRLKELAVQNEKLAKTPKA
jgi:hypothetical protein